MIEWFLYITKSTILLFLITLAYLIWFRKVNWFTFNRIYLVVGLVIATTLPLLDWGISKPSPEAITVNLGEKSANIEQSTFQINISDAQAFETRSRLLMTFYFLISAGLAILMAINVIKVSRFLMNKGSASKEIAFSFLKWTFVHKGFHERPSYTLIKEHENVHARQMHTLDVLLIEFLKILFWINPVLWFYKNLIKENHEFLADQWVLHKYPQMESLYQQQILELQLSPLDLDISNNLNILHYKKRFEMMKKEPLNFAQKAVYVFYLFLTIVFIAACDSLLDSKNAQINTTFDFAALDEQPVYGDNFESFYHHLQKTITYPNEARANKIEGRFFAAFTITESGEISDIEISKEDNSKFSKIEEIVVVGYGSNEMESDNKTIGEQAIIQAMTDALNKSETFNPGKKNDKVVSTRMVLPITYKLE